jgi:anion-transporting  ArsA/GET3 family ATPase
VSGVGDFLDSHPVVIGLGAGGVGKTSITAALGIAAARRGLRCCVVTIDPARRLANALGLDALDNMPVEIAGDWPGSLAALMLDPRATFADLITRYATDEAQAARIAENTLYQSLVDQLGGTQEYMATEKLFELHTSGAFDLVLVDTPPSRSALDFLHAPSRLAGFLENPVLRLLLVPGRISMRAVGLATRLLLRTIGKVAGSEVVEDTVAFFQAFEGMEAGFRERARQVEALLAAPETGYLLVTVGRETEAGEAVIVGERLHDLGHDVNVVVANRTLTALADTDALTGQVPPGLEQLYANLAELATLARAEEAVLQRLVATLAPPELVRVPLLAGDVHDLDGLGRLADVLVS